MKKYLRYLGPLLVTCIFVGAIYLLYHKLKAYDMAQIRESMDQISHWRILASIGLMIINYIILIGYDWLALIAIRKPLPLRRTALVSFIGQAVSYNFGALLGGTTVRYRFYSAWGFSLEEIVRLVLMLAVTFWVGALGLCGLVFIISPPDIPIELLEKMPLKDVRILGVILLSIAMTYLVMCFFVRKPVHIFGKEFVFPPPKIAILQAIVAGVDLIAAAGCMYVLLPSDLNITFIQFLPSYLMAQVAVVLTHVPGGVGVFELVILHMTHTPREQVVVAAVLCFRIIYFILPLLGAAVLLAVYEAHQRKNMLREAGRWLNVLSHTIAAIATFVAGIILIVASILPTWPDMRTLIITHVPAWLVPAAHFTCILSGALLLFVAYGLERRQAIAWRASIILLVLGIVASLFKGFNWVAAGMVSMVLLCNIASQRRYYRKSFFWEEPIPLRWLGGAWAVLGSAVALGWYIYSPVLDKANLWGFDRAHNVSQNYRALIGVVSILFALWLWRVWQRRRHT